MKLKKVANIEQVNNVLKEKGLPFITEGFKNKLIPFDDYFRCLYKGRFTCTEELKLQQINGVVNNLILLKFLK